MKQKKKFTLARRRAITGLLFVSPWIIGFFTYYVKSLYQTVYMAFSDVTQAETGGFVSTLKGIDNFKYAFMVDADFNQILVTSVKDILLLVFPSPDAIMFLRNISDTVKYLKLLYLMLK